jgi:hypothetical protein
MNLDKCLLAYVKDLIWHDHAFLFDLLLLQLMLLVDRVHGHVDAPQEIWKDFKECISTEGKKVEVKLDFDDKTNSVHFVGRKGCVDSLKTVAEKIKMEQLEESKKKMLDKSEALNLKPHHVSLLHDIEYDKELTANFQQLQISFSEEKVLLRGPADVVKQAEEYILHKVAWAEKRNVAISEATENLFRVDVVRQKLRECFQQKKILASLTLLPQTAVVHALSVDDLSKAIAVIQSEYVDLKFPLAPGNKQVLSRPLWKDFVHKLRSDVQLIAVDTRNDDVLVVSTTKTCANSVKDEVDKFFKENTLVETDVEMLQAVAELIERYMKDELDKIQAKLSKCNGQLQIIRDDKNSCFHVTASEQLTDDVERELQKLAERIVMSDYEIDKPGIPNYLMSSSGQHFLYGLQVKHEAVIELGNYEPKGATVASFSGQQVHSYVITKKQVKKANSYCMV